MSEIRVTTLKDTGGGNSSTTAEIFSGRAKAWVNMNGQGVVAIRGSFNVNSMSDVSTGRFKTNFSSALGDGNYAAAGWVSDRSYGATISNNSGAFQSGSHEFFTAQEIHGPLFDPEHACVAYFR